MPGADEPTAARLAALAAAGGIAYWHGRPADAERYYSEQVDLSRQLGDRAAEADGTFNLSFEQYIRGDASGSLEMLQQAREIFEEVGDERGMARVDWSMVTVGTGEHPNIGGLVTLEALNDRFERIGDTWYAYQNYMSIAWVHFSSGDVAEASRWFIRAMVGYRSLRDVAGTTIAIPLAALLALEADRAEDAATLLGASDHLTELYGVKAPMGLQDLLGISDPRGRAMATLGETAYRAAYERGDQMTLDQTVALIVRMQDETWGPG
jgi:tetratricopeptide (TPR) repeat protein